MSRTATTITQPRRRAKRRPRSQIEPLLPRLKKILEDLYGERLVSVILYGSFARDKATEDSDIDIAVVLKGKVDKMAELHTIHEVTDDLAITEGELLSFHPLDESEMGNNVWPLYHWIRQEGIKL